MKNSLKVGVAVAVALFFLASPLWAGNSAVNPNGFPSGPHYNLNIIGKKAGFTCPSPELDANGNPVYGNVVFVPENGSSDSIQILFESGLKGPKSAPTITELQVTDPCTGFTQGDSAKILLPPNSAGYRVYARALAKPTDNPYMVINPDLVSAQDELGNDLYFLGSLGSFNYFSWGTNTIYRMKGKSQGVDITPLFEFTGEVCYLSTDPGLTYTEKQVCVLDSNADGIYEDMIPADFITYTETGCPVGYSLTTAYCAAYTQSWVFNIADFVDYLWGLDNNGLKLLQVRFYPN